VRRDIVVIGCSAGGVEALPSVIEKLPKGFGAAVFVVMHMAPSRDAYLVDILRRRSVLPVTWADQGERYEAGHVYVAPRTPTSSSISGICGWLGPPVRTIRGRPSTSCSARRRPRTGRGLPPCS
jgi:chemotaxis response regulator CheB